MFNKQPRTNLQNHPEPKPQANVDHIHPVNVEPMKSYEPPTLVNGSVIGADLTILGENINIVSKETLQIDGEIHGDISGKKINIGNSGKVVGTISAETVEIDGGVQGTVRAQAVQLNAEANVSGELLHQTLVVSEGAVFEGSVRRPRDVSELTPNLENAQPQPVAKPQALDTTNAAPAEPVALEPYEASVSQLDRLEN